MRKPDFAYYDILASDIYLYAGLSDEECHKLEVVTGPDGVLRFNIQVWLKEE